MQKKYRKFHIIILIILILTIITPIIAALLLFQLDDNGNNQTSETTKLSATELSTTELSTTISITSSSATTTTTKKPFDICKPNTNTTDYDSVFGKLIFIDDEYRIIRFNQTEKLDLKFLFEAVNCTYEDEHFEELYIENQYIQSINEDILGEIRIDEIYIQDCQNLEYIHYNAFGNQTKFIKKFKVMENLPNLKSVHNSDYDLYRLINLLVNCEYIHIKSFDKELKSIKLNKLKELYFYVSSIEMESINSYAFYECDSIEEINLDLNNINYISEN